MLLSIFVRLTDMPPNQLETEDFQRANLGIHYLLSNSSKILNTTETGKYFTYFPKKLLKNTNTAPCFHFISFFFTKMCPQ